MKMRHGEVMVLLLAVASFASGDLAAPASDNCSATQISPPRVRVFRPIDGEKITGYHGGGQGMRQMLHYEVQHLPRGGRSRVSIVRNEALVDCKRCAFTEDVVDRPYWLIPGFYEWTIIVEDANGRELARHRVSCEVELPEYAREVRVLGTSDTLMAVAEAIAGNKSGAYLRFGDGDLNIAVGRHDQMQAHEEGLTLEMQAALAMHGGSVIKGLMITSPLFGGVEEGMSDGNHLLSDNLALGFLEMASRFWRPAPITEIYSNAALAHAASTYPELALDFLLHLRLSRPVALVGNRNLPPALIYALFGQQVIHIKTPPRDAYRHIEDLHAQVLRLLATNTQQVEHGEHALSDAASRQAAAGAAGSQAVEHQPQHGQGVRVVVMAAGAAGLALQNRLWGGGEGVADKGWSRVENLFTFDFGSLIDALSEFRNRGGLEGDDATSKAAPGVVHAGEQPGWIKASGFDKDKRKQFLSSFCEAIQHLPDPCHPTLLD